MMRTSVAALLGLILSTLFLSPSAKASVFAGPITWPENGHQYYLLSQNTWTASQSEAVSLGGNLVTINSAAEDAWVFDTFAGAGASGRAIWIGYQRTTTGGPFGWVSGEPDTYSHWAPAEPNYADEFYTYMLPTLNGNPVAGAWNNDYDRSSSTYTGLGFYIPEFAIHGVVEVIPEPTSLALIAMTASVLFTRNRRTTVIH